MVKEANIRLALKHKYVLFISLNKLYKYRVHRNWTEKLFENKGRPVNNILISNNQPQISNYKSNQNVGWRVGKLDR